MNKRQLAAQGTKKRLITAGLELIKEKGFEAINVEDITRKAGVAKGTFYTYFKRKEDIVLEISRTPFGEIADELDKMESVSLFEKLTRYFHRFMEQVEFCGIQICREWIRHVIDPNNVPENLDSKKWFYDYEMLENILKKAVDKDELTKETPIELLTHIIISQLYGMMTSWCMSDGKFEPLEWTDKFCEEQLEAIFGKYIRR